MSSDKVGKELPDVTVYEGSPDGAVKISEACANKKCVIVGVPGAFTPTCSKNHLPGYVESYDKLKSLNVDLIAFVSVVDPFVMAAWGESANVGDKIRMWADMHMELTKALDVVLDIANVLGTSRSQRYAMIVEGNVIKHFLIEEEPSKAITTSAASVIKVLES